MSKFSKLKVQTDGFSGTQNSADTKTQNATATKNQQVEDMKAQISEISATQKRSVGRPRGKRSDPSYKQVTAYVKAGTHRAVQHRLLDEGKEFSELIEDLLSEWLINE